jgi:type II secretory ATPase GspE/PulE/Tfp pilus assembly ATPase PilB-like protein
MRKTPDATLKLSRKSPDRTLKLQRGAADTTAKMTARAPDITAKMSRAALEAAMAAAAPAAFQWPAPPYYEYADGSAAGVHEDCLLTFGDGARVAGTLLAFSPEEMLLKFRQDNADAGVSIAFSALHSVELPRPVAMRRQALPEGMEERVFAASDRQPFTIQLASGKLLEGHTVGHVEALCGLFLFLPDENGAVLRHFIPAQTIRQLDIGKPLGEMLLAQNLVSPETLDSALQRQSSLRGRRFGEHLTENRIVSPEQLADALKKQHAQPVQRLGETLVELGYLSPAELEEALDLEQRNRSIPLGRILSDMGVLDADVINSVMAQKLGIPFVSLAAFTIAPEILKRVPAQVAHRYQVIPLAESDHALVVAVDNPMDMAKMGELRFATGSKLIPVMASASDIRQALQANYGGLDRWEVSPSRAAGEARAAALPASQSPDTDLPVEELTARLAAESADLDLNEQHAAQNDTTLVKLVNKIILDAVAQKASDIHIESNPGGKGTRVRFRKDGVLVTYLDMPARFRRAVISRIKIMSQLDITERRRPQDGKIEFSRFGPARVELRVASIPTSAGLEDVVMRVLSAATPVAIDDLGFDEAALAAIKQMMARPHGLFLVCGPTGSGKTTTLHSLLGYLNTDDRKIWTAEDPIEIQQPGLRQVQVNAKIGWIFAAAMRSFMRADPDIIMVGEMRDAETAKIGIEASLTGHLVLTTLHTNSAVESVVRLLDLGMDPFNFADALLGVLSQRLVRRLCEECKQPYAASEPELDELSREYCEHASADPAAVLGAWRRKYGRSDGRIVLHRAQGCEHCDHSGYSGRLGVYELLVADGTLKRQIQQRGPVVELSATALANGMRTLKQDGIERVLKGVTDIRQVRRV